MSFLIGLHVIAIVGVFVTISLAIQGRNGPAITFAILSALTAVALMLWWIAQSEEAREAIKTGVDVISLTSVAVFLGVVVWVAIWDESPRAPGHLSVQSKILAWDAAPITFGVSWLIVRYANALVARFPRLVSHDGKPGLLFYFVNLVLALVFLEQLFAFPDWVLAPLWILALVGFIWFAFRQGFKVTPNKENRDDWDNFGGPPDGHTGSQF